VPETPDVPTASNDSALTEDLALALLKRPDLLASDVRAPHQELRAAESRKVRLALAAHPRASRRLALRLVREFYTFDLMHFCNCPPPRRPEAHRRRISNHAPCLDQPRRTNLAGPPLLRHGRDRAAARQKNRASGRPRWKIHASPRLPSLADYSARAPLPHLSMPYAITASGPCVLKFA